MPRRLLRVHPHQKAASDEGSVRMPVVDLPLRESTGWISDPILGDGLEIEYPETQPDR